MKTIPTVCIRGHNRIKGVAMKTFIIISLAGASIALAPASHALPPNCIGQPWGFLGSETRVLCDGPVRPDGSWRRDRAIGIPRHYENPSSYCSGGAYYSSCSFNPGGWVDTQLSDAETYDVRPDTVLPDEPGHIGPPVER